MIEFNSLYCCDWCWQLKRHEDIEIGDFLVIPKYFEMLRVKNKTEFYKIEKIGEDYLIGVERKYPFENEYKTKNGIVQTYFKKKKYHRVLRMPLITLEDFIINYYDVMVNDVDIEFKDVTFVVDKDKVCCNGGQTDFYFRYYKGIDLFEYL